MAVKDLVRDHLMPAIATAALLGGGATVVQDRIDNVRQDARIERIEKLDQTMEKLASELSTTRETLARVEGRQEKYREPRRL